MLNFLLEKEDYLSCKYRIIKKCEVLSVGLVFVSKFRNCLLTQGPGLPFQLRPLPRPGAGDPTDNEFMFLVIYFMYGYDLGDANLGILVKNTQPSLGVRWFSISRP